MCSGVLDHALHPQDGIETHTHHINDTVVIISHSKVLTLEEDFSETNDIERMYLNNRSQLNSSNFLNQTYLVINLLENSFSHRAVLDALNGLNKRT